MKDSHYRISLDIHSTQSQVSLPVKQGDTSRKVFISLCEGGKPYHIEEDCFAVFCARKPDGEEIDNNCIIADNVIEYTFTEQTTAASGIVNSEIRLYGVDSGLITSPRFTVIVDSRVVSDANIESHSEYTALDTLVSEAVNTIEDANKKAGHAQTQGDHALEKGNYANEMAELAKSMATDALTAKYAADAAATIATTAATNANTAATSASTSATSAATAADNANMATTRANTAAANANSVADGIRSSVSNALKGTASGNPIRLDDVSPVEHTVRCKVSGKNLVAYPFPETTLTRYGITYTDNGDGSITVNGTATANSHFIFKGKSNLPVGKYAFSGCPAGGSASTYYMTVNGFYGIKSDIGSGGSLEVKNDSPQTNFVIIVMAGTTVSNLVFKPQVEKGDTATEYAHYVDPTAVTVSRCGKNLLPFYSDLATKTVNGVTFTVNADKSVTCNGTATDNAVFRLTTDFRLPLGVYTLLGCPTNGSENARLQTNKVIDGVAKTGAIDIGSGGVLLVDDEYNVYTYIVVVSGQTVSNMTFKPMLQFGEGTDVLYESTINDTYTPNADGTVEVTSLYPTTTLICDTAGVTIETEYNKDLNKVIADLIDRIGSGGSGASAFITDITILASKWVGTSSPYSQVVTVEGATKRSQVDLTPSVEQLATFRSKDLTFVTENIDGVITVYAIGQKPTNDYTIQATVTEVNV